MAEVLSNERMKFIAAQHQAEFATIRVQHQAKVAAIHAQYQADMKVISVQHEADIAMSKAELQHQSEMLGAKLEMAEHRVAVLKEEIALARHKNFESTMMSVRSTVMGEISNPNFRIVQH